MASTATIQFQIPAGDQATLNVYDLKGRLVRQLFNGRPETESLGTVWDGKNNLGIRVAAGTYLLRLDAGSGVLTRKIVLLEE